MKKKNSLIGSLFSIIVLLVIAGCTSTTTIDDEELPVPNERKDIVLNWAERGIVSTQNAFSLRFFNEAAKHKAENMIVSPLSMSMALSMLSNGAVGDTRAEMLDALGFEDKDMDAVNTFNNRLTKELAAVDNTVMQSLANSIWIDYSAKIKDSFIFDNKAAYNAEIFTDNLSLEESMNRINEWCSDKTHGMIYPFLNEPTESLITLINALYFKGRWADPFDPANTSKGKFHNSDGSTSTVDMMRDEKTCRYGTFKDAVWVTLSYGNTAYRAVFIMPEENSGLSVDEYMASLTEAEFKEGLLAGNAVELDVSLPKFEISYKNKRMNSILCNIGFKKMFTDGDFSGITDTPLAFEVVQEAKIKLDEKGTEAAAVTGIHGYLSPGPMQKLSITFDRPFAFLIKEYSTGAVLFMGRVSGF